MNRIWNNLAKNRGYFLVTLLAGITFSGISVLTPTISGYMITALMDDAEKGGRLIALFVIAGVVQIILSLLDDYLGMHFKLRQKQVMREKIVASFVKKDSAGREKISGFVSFVNNDIPSIVEQYFAGTIDIVKCVSILAFSAISMFSVHFVLTIVVFVVSGLIVLCPKVLRKQGRKARTAYSEALGRYNTSLQSFLDGLRIVKSYNYYKRVNQIQEGANEQIAKKEKELIRCQLSVHGMTGFLQVGKTLLVLIVGVILITYKQMEIGGLIAVVQLAEMISVPAEVLACMIHARNEVLPILDEYEKLIAEKDLLGERYLLSDKVENITLYDVAYVADELRILDDVTALFEAGKNYLISGESGSGKSTLMRLISQIGDLNYSGTIACNGKNLKEVSGATYYQKVCPVFQEPYLFHATLEENILLGRDISRNVYLDVIAKLNLDYLLERYHGQEITPEILEQISGGERQRVALARAMVGRPEVYLLDEVTSALDAVNSETIEEILLDEEAMVIHICHKSNPKLLSKYDGKYVMEKGHLLVG